MEGSFCFVELEKQANCFTHTLQTDDIGDGCKKSIKD